jgi:glucosamine--fructose-6-phosphate aminotransferase (isomerizing)
MCGIIGITGHKGVVDRLLSGLERLEYRGYDSAGLAIQTEGHLACRRAPGKIGALKKKVSEAPLEGVLGIAHTRWATHGAPTEKNAHPHMTQRVALVHNGIIENYGSLKKDLLSQGCQFHSETDTEVIVHLVDRFLEKGLSPLQAVQSTLSRLEGAFALAIIFADQPHLLIGARRGSPLVIGYGEEEMYLGSDALALAPLTQKISYLEEGDVCVLMPQSVTVYSAKNEQVDRPLTQTSLSHAMIGKGEYPHFMLKEIHEQPLAAAATLTTFLQEDQGKIHLPQGAPDLSLIERITIVACGTSYYAGMVAKYWIETVARIPVEVDIASEFRYRRPPMPPKGLTLFISQSGETADTLGALTYAKEQGQTLVSVVNVPTSSLARLSHVALLTHAGPEIGVASTKAFTTQLMVLAAFTLALAQSRKTLSPDAHEELLAALRTVPFHMDAVLQKKEELKALSHQLVKARDVLFLGRGSQYPIALEGALKLKEISYIHAEGYPAGEMKHGPIALIDSQVPLVILAPSDGLYEKTVSNVQEAMARGGQVLLVTDAPGRAKFSGEVMGSFLIPSVNPFIAPLITALPIQLLAYYTAVLKGTDVDQPRNLAKSVTVE